MTDTAKTHDHWRVSVETGGELIVAIETECLSGRELSPQDEATIKLAAQHLLAFVGGELLERFEALRQQGYAPGNYWCFCGECGRQHTADKRAQRCLTCAEKRAAINGETDGTE